MSKIFTVTAADIKHVLQAFGIEQEPTEWKEITRYHYEENDPSSNEVRLILSVKLSGGNGLIVKFLNETEHPRSQVEEQSQFSEILRLSGVSCARKIPVSGSSEQYTLPMTIDGREVYVTAEDFVLGELKSITEENAFEVGVLHARAHQISEKKQCHVSGRTLFDPFEENDLVFYNIFKELSSKFPLEFQSLIDEITTLYENHMNALEPLRAAPAYAVQGDISNCNLYRAPDGSIGMFDFNNCADNRLMCDTIMQGIFLSRLMDYEEPATPEFSLQILKSFLRGYCSVRKISPEEQQYFPHLYAIINAFWVMDIKYGENSLRTIVEKYEKENSPQLSDLIRQKLIYIKSVLSDAGRSTGITRFLSEINN